MNRMAALVNHGLGHFPRSAPLEISGFDNDLANARLPIFIEGQWLCNYTNRRNSTGPGHQVAHLLEHSGARSDVKLPPITPPQTDDLRQTNSDLGESFRPSVDCGWMSVGRH
jgi:hypothetical protein